jgi:hypothetical protein
MINLLNIFTPSSTNIFFVAGVVGMAGFMLGFIIKSASIARNKKRIVSLEDEMLLNHSRILDLEKLVSQLKEENAKISNTSLPKVELKAS